LLLAAGCDDSAPVTGPCALAFEHLRHLRIDEVRAPDPVVAGTRLRVRGESFIDAPSCYVSEAVLSGVVDGDAFEALLVPEIESANELSAELPSAHAGHFDGALILRFRSVDRGDDAFAARLELELEMAHDLTPAAVRVEERDAFLEDELTVTGSGFLDGAGEGTTKIVLDGTYTDDDGRAVGVFGVVLPSSLRRADERSAVRFPWEPHIAGLVPGVFRGTLTPRNEHVDRTVSEGASIEIEITQRETELQGLSPSEVSLGQILDIEGRGFIGASRADEGERHASMALRLAGELIPCDGPLQDCWDEAVPFEAELATTWSSGALARYGLIPTSDGGELRAVDFGIRQGFFVGSATPVLALGDDRREAAGLDETTLTLGPVRQVVWVDFIPGFADSLELLGLGAVAGEVERRVLERMREIYCPPGEPDRCANVELRTDEPEDYVPQGYALIEIGGPDPNGLGLLGYDASESRDINNLRLGDHVGGRNALGGVDGVGYGGVFVESFLFYSEHPPIDEAPEAAPEPDPLFDAVFDPLREHEVMADEYPAGASAARLGEIETAIHVISSLVADTAAHELGHTLGLANPGLPDGPAHRLADSPGCLMDAGEDRPFAERARLEGNPGAGFCDEEIDYLQYILPR
jgi:hypothetical protein